MNSLTQWKRPLWTPGGGDAEIAVVAFSERPLPDGFTLAEDRHGAPSAGVPEPLDLRTVSAEDNAEWIHGFFEEGLLESARVDLGWEQAPLERALHAHYLSGTFPDPADLDHLQAVWALQRALKEAGAFAMLDLFAVRWLAPEDIDAVPLDAPFDLDREIAIIIETGAADDGPLVCHTRGLRKFGRPDLLILNEEGTDDEEAVGLLRALAEPLALGEQVGVGDTFRTEDGVERPFLAYDPEGEHPDVHLQNVGLVVGTAL